MLLRRLAVLVAVLALLLLVLAGPGARLGLWEFRFGFQLLRWSAWAGIAAAVLALVALLVPAVRRTAPMMLALALVLGLAVAFVPWNLRRVARAVPPIHDITTDTQNPPEFVAVAPLRANARNPITYAGDTIAAQQRRAYPDIQPLALPTTPERAFARALDAARGMGWEIVAADSASGRIEATATTRWFGFKDDVVVRIARDGNGSRVDVRSKSRVGGSDLGANAARIRAFLARVRA